MTRRTPVPISMTFIGAGRFGGCFEVTARVWLRPRLCFVIVVNLWGIDSSAQRLIQSDAAARHQAYQIPLSKSNRGQQTCEDIGRSLHVSRVNDLGYWYTGGYPLWVPFPGTEVCPYASDFHQGSFRFFRINLLRWVTHSCECNGSGGVFVT